MKIRRMDGVLGATLDSLKGLYGTSGLRIDTLDRVVIKPGWSIVIGSNGSHGIAMNFTGAHSVYGEVEMPARLYQPFVGRSLFDVAEENLDSPDMRLNSLGIAALCALSQPFISPDALRKRGYGSTEGIRHLAGLVREDDVAAVIGYGASIRPLLGRVRELNVTDMRPPATFSSLIVGKTVEHGPKGVRVYTHESNARVLAKADVVIITGSSFVNNTFSDLVGAIKKARLVGVFGPSASFVPDVLLDHGLDFVVNFWIGDPARFVFDAENDTDMQAVLKMYQRQQLVRPGDEGVLQR